ncbi:uncharacterized protein LOC131657786 [Vicia villosa]|uniref:uncharacterized protein LOC131657786 n=1 Tax=Vicia villosa TaxID=3911 RepID=UPI00273CC8DC|nr:uncharacterized protein LOC131657786 [Vicia villosa]
MDEDVTNVNIDNVAEGENMNEADNVVKGENNGEGEDNAEGLDNAEGMDNAEGENNVKGKDNAEGEYMNEADNNIDDGTDDDSDFVADSDEESLDLDWTIVLPIDTSAMPTENVVDEDSDQLYTPPGSEYEEEYEHFPNFQSSEIKKFKLGLVFNNKDVIKDDIKEDAMVNNKNVYFKKNDVKRIVVNCEEGCNYHMRFSKRAGNQFWQITSLYEEHACVRTAYKRQSKTGWLAKQFVHIFIHTPNMKPAGLIAIEIERWGVNLSTDQTYRAKRKVVELPLTGLDACFLKGGYGGQLMAAVGSDGNNQIFPIANAVVEAETKDSWECFINLLLVDLQSVNKVS